MQKKTAETPALVQKIKEGGICAALRGNLRWFGKIAGFIVFIEINMRLLIVFAANFKIAAGMSAGRTDLGRACAHNDMPAVAAFPYLYFASGKNLGRFNIMQQRTVALFMVLFNSGNQTEFCCQFGETFFLGGFGKARRTYQSIRSFRLQRHEAGFRRCRQYH